MLGAVQVDRFGPLSGPGTSALAELPRDAFPRLAETAAHARRVSRDREFRAGLDAVLRGLSTRP